MTKKELARGVELRRTIDGLYEMNTRLKEMEKLCFENMNIAKSVTHRFVLKAIKKQGGCDTDIEVSANAAYSAVCKDRNAINAELEKLNKEFEDL